MPWMKRRQGQEGRQSLTQLQRLRGAFTEVSGFCSGREEEMMVGGEKNRTDRDSGETPEEGHRHQPAHRQNGSAREEDLNRLETSAFLLCAA